MSCQERYNALYSCAKKWNPLFSNDQNFEERNTYLECRQVINADGDELSIFLRDSEESGPSSEAEEILEFCKSECVEEEVVEEVGGEEGKKSSGWKQYRAAWLDDRSFGVTSSEGVRIYEDRLTPAALYKHLNTPVWSHDYQAKKNCVH